jgi:hypothetical protein
MGFGDYARPLGIVAGRFTAGKEALVVQSIARKKRTTGLSVVNTMTTKTIKFGQTNLWKPAQF